MSQTYFAKDGNIGNAKDLLVFDNELLAEFEAADLMKFVDDAPDEEKPKMLACISLLHRTKRAPLLGVLLVDISTIRQHGFHVLLDHLVGVPDVTPTKEVVFCGDLAEHTAEIDLLKAGLLANVKEVPQGLVITFHHGDPEDLSTVLSLLTAVQQKYPVDDRHNQEIYLETLNESPAELRDFCDEYERLAGHLEMLAQGGTRE